jgi:hypothetical protein
MKIKIISLFLLVLVLVGCPTIKKQIDLARQKERKFKVDMKSPKIPIGPVEAQLDKVLSGLKKVNVNVSYSPVEDAVCLDFKRNTVTNYQFFNRANRTAFLIALEKYIEDYDQRNLVNSKKTKYQYGNEEGYLIWKLTKVSEQYSANLDFSYGYLFRQKSPFFTITQGEAIHEDIFKGTEEERFSTNGEFQLFFTRAQAVELAGYFDQQFLRSLTSGQQTIDQDINYDAY